MVELQRRGIFNMWVQIILEKMKFPQEALKLALNVNELIEFEEYFKYLKNNQRISLLKNLHITT